MTRQMSPLSSSKDSGLFFVDMSFDVNHKKKSTGVRLHDLEKSDNDIKSGILDETAQGKPLKTADLSGPMSDGKFYD